MQGLFRQVHAGVAWLLLAAIVVQVWLAGSAIPQLGGTGSFETHRDVGYTIGIVTLALVLTALAARVGRRRIGQALGLLVLYVVQSSLPYFDPSLPAVAALHPVNAVLMAGMAFVYARAVWRQRSAPVTAAAPATA
jgi:hypothetical protein